MKSQNTPFRAFLFLTFYLATHCWAEPIWHCSRNTGGSRDEVVSQANQFALASMGSSEDVIGVSISDLIDVYGGTRVSIGGEPLSACFMSGYDALTSSALKSLGLQPSAIQALARKSTIVQSHLYLVTDEKQMQTCIERHFPAVGYLASPVETERMMPCF